MSLCDDTAPSTSETLASVPLASRAGAGQEGPREDVKATPGSAAWESRPRLTRRGCHTLTGCDRRENVRCRLTAHLDGAPRGERSPPTRMQPPESSPSRPRCRGAQACDLGSANQALCCEMGTGATLGKRGVTQSTPVVGVGGERAACSLGQWRQRWLSRCRCHRASLGFQGYSRSQATSCDVSFCIEGGA